MTTATLNTHGPTPERTLFLAFELSEKTWKLGFTTGHGQPPRERSIAAEYRNFKRHFRPNPPAPITIPQPFAYPLPV